MSTFEEFFDNVEQQAKDDPLYKMGFQAAQAQIKVEIAAMMEEVECCLVCGAIADPAEIIQNALDIISKYKLRQLAARKDNV